MFEGDSADTLTGKFPLVLMGGRAEGLACADPGARTAIGMSRNLLSHSDLLNVHFSFPLLSACINITISKDDFHWSAIS